MSKAKAIAGGAVVYFGGLWAGWKIFGENRESPETHVSDGCAFERLAPTYDARIERSERISGILKMRKRLLGDASGSVLEVAAGTGRNMEFYPKNAYVTMVDVSENMIKVAKEKAKEKKFDAGFWVGDSQKLPFDDNVFDNVVDTFGLCSLDDPKRAVQEMARVCKPNGHVRLLEHGRSGWFSLLNRYLDARALQHVKDWGCEWNRDIDSIISQCEGLERESSKFHHFGTTYEVVLRKTP